MSPVSGSSSTGADGGPQQQPAAAQTGSSRGKAARGAATGGGAGSGSCASREWLYALVTFPDYFTPCRQCCTGCRTPKREQLLTLFDTQAPHGVFCSHCPEFVERGSTAALLQVRRSSFKNVVNAVDIVRFGADTSGVQHYTLNSNKVLYLSREQPEKRGNNATAPPSMCIVDGRSMMDKTAQFCSLKCKMTAEDPGFSRWLEAQAPGVREAAEAAANAPPRPTAACKRGAPRGGGGSSDDGDDSGSGSDGEDSDSNSSGYGSLPKRQAVMRFGSGNGEVSSSQLSSQLHHSSGSGSRSPASGLLRAGSAPAPSAFAGPASAPAGGGANGGVCGTPAGLRPIRTSAAGLERQATAPAGTLGAAGGPLGGRAAPPAGGVAGSSCSSWAVHNGVGELAVAVDGHVPWTAWEACGGGCGSLSYDVLDQQVFGDGSLSPALVAAPDGGSVGASSRDWWLCGTGGAVAAAPGAGGGGGAFADHASIGFMC